jgi:glycosyltransferase involved in cell wall biosynthesis
MLIEAIRRMRIRQLEWGSKVSFEVTGKGESLVELQQLAAEPGHPMVKVHGRLSDVRYREVLRACQIGLALKPVGGVLADTTFPSKVIEFASSGLLVLSTDISDVRSLLGEGAHFLERNDPDLLIEQLGKIVEDRRSAEFRAIQGHLAVEQQCAPQAAGVALRNFLFTAGT